VVVAAVAEEVLVKKAEALVPEAIENLQALLQVVLQEVL